MDNNQSHNGFEAAMPEELVSALGTPDESWLLYMRQLRADFARLMMEYNAGINEVMTKIGILQEEFVHLHRYNPIEHVSSRVKKPDSLIKKVVSKGIGLSTESIRASITDIAGVRVTCSFIADTYRVLDALTKQDDVKVLEIKDYIEDPKPSGYKSLHAIIEVPVFLSTGPVPVVVEVQIRTIAMDFWASLSTRSFISMTARFPTVLSLTCVTRPKWPNNSTCECRSCIGKSTVTRVPSRRIRTSILTRTLLSSCGKQRGKEIRPKKNKKTPPKGIRPREKTVLSNE